MASIARMLLLALAASPSAGEALYSMSSLPDSQKRYEMQLQLTAPEGGAVVPLTYAVVPLTLGAGLNQSQTGIDVSSLRGASVPAVLVLTRHPLRDLCAQVR